MVNKWLVRLSVLYLLWFACGFLLLGGSLPARWLAWANGIHLILGGITALLWYARKFGARQALLLFVICSSISYAAGWLSLQAGPWFGAYAHPSSFAPLVLGVPLAIPFAWCMLLIIAKAFAPIKPAPGTSRGFTLSEKLSAGLPSLKKERRQSKRRSFWLPAIWAASMVSSIELLLKPVSAPFSGQAWIAERHSVGIRPWELMTWSSYIYWWLTALLIISLVNYLHDEYLDGRDRSVSKTPLMPLLLLLTMESLFLTLAVRSGLWWAAALNLSLLALLFLLRAAHPGR
ncbi:carotenoid biosynthesis protein [Paenibacillus puerhi]|uniref:carotenoid biosynthesis protein n=1 Tax=Paenibacillus puerhi TaxID=2692622 RepID=UPI001357981B|nr:carotenoid biosynthesis protein [Paenibacillus puerhi]